MNLVIDIGNTRVKTGVFEHDELVDAKVFDEVDILALQDIADTHAVMHAIVASTGVASDEIPLQVAGAFLRFTPEMPVPIDSAYRTPKTLGSDRIAAMVAAAWLHPGKNVLVVDAGTCITYDFLEKSGIYIGGNIAPGLNMRYHAMHAYTQRLPEVTRPETAALHGQTTEEALQNGGLMGILMEIAGYVEILRTEYTELNTLLTGGDASYLAEHLKTGLSLQPHLVLIGLNQILNFNVAKYN